MDAMRRTKQVTHANHYTPAPRGHYKIAETREIPATGSSTSRTPWHRIPTEMHIPIVEQAAVTRDGLSNEAEYNTEASQPSFRCITEHQRNNDPDKLNICSGAHWAKKSICTNGPKKTTRTRRNGYCRPLDLRALQDRANRNCSGMVLLDQAEREGMRNHT